MAYTVKQLQGMSNADLDKLFSSSPAGDIPNGPAEGNAIVDPGTTFGAEIDEFIKLMVWKGKTFDAQKGELKNRILPMGVKAIVAKVYKGNSWLDNKECIVLDYSQTSLVAHWIRDEIRLIAPGFYLGRVYWDKKPLIHFCLQFDAAAATAQT
jgi:hypothetical protein